MRVLSKELLNRKIDINRLIQYGFKVNDNVYVYETYILDNEFKVIVNVDNNVMTSKLIEVSFDDEYLMVDVIDAIGEYIGKVKCEYDKVIKDIIDKCTIFEVFLSLQSLEIIKYVKNKYGDDVEYLWEKSPKNAVARNKVNNKWYLAILTVKENRVGGKTEKEIEVIDLMYQKDKINDIVDERKVYPGYHMNKKSWITIKLDGSVDIKTIKDFIDNSYKLSLGK